MSVAIEVVESDVAAEELTGAKSVKASKLPSWLPAVVVLGAVIILTIWFGFTQYQIHVENEQLQEHVKQIMQSFIARYPNTNMKP